MRLNNKKAHKHFFISRFSLQTHSPARKIVEMALHDRHEWLVDGPRCSSWSWSYTLAARQFARKIGAKNSDIEMLQIVGIFIFLPITRCWRWFWWWDSTMAQLTATEQSNSLNSFDDNTAVILPFFPQLNVNVVPFLLLPISSLLLFSVKWHWFINVFSFVFFLSLCRRPGCGN